MTPVIGITRCSHLDDYVSSVEQAGARARILEVTESPRDVIGELHGLLLTGGGDIDPAFYGEARHETVEDAEPGRDEFELDLARRAIDADLPVLAICRGAQVLNVAAGGSLVQDLVTEPPLSDAPAARARDPDAERSRGARRQRVGRIRPRARARERRGRPGPVPREQPASPIRPAPRPLARRVRDRAGRSDRSHRGARRALLRRRPVAPRKLLADGRVPAAVRRIRRRGDPDVGLRARVQGSGLRAQGSGGSCWTRAPVLGRWWYLRKAPASRAALTEGRLLETRFDPSALSLEP